MDDDERFPTVTSVGWGTLESISAPWWSAALAITIAVVACTGMFATGWFLGRDVMRPDVTVVCCLDTTTTTVAAP